MQASIWMFLLFLGAQVVLIIASAIPIIIVGAKILNDNRISQGNIMLNLVAMEVLSYFFLSLFLLILTGENFFLTFAILLVVSIVLMALVELLWLVFGTRNVPFLGRTLWAKWEFEKMVPGGKLLPSLLGLLILLGYNVFLGIGYFGEHGENDGWASVVLRATLVFILCMGWLVNLPSNLYVMTSVNVMEGTRSRLFMNQLASSASFLMLTALYLRAAGWSGRSIGLLGEQFVFTPTVAYVVVGYVLLVLVVPFLIGHYRSLAWIEKLEGRRAGLVEHLREALKSPSIIAARERLTQVAQEIGAEIDRITRTKGVRLALEVTHSREQEVRLYQLAIDEAKDRDPRFIHHARLRKMQETLGEYQSELDQVAETQQKQLLAEYLKHIEDGDAKTSDTQKTKNWVLILLTFLAMALINPIVSSASKIVVAQIGLGE